MEIVRNWAVYCSPDRYCVVLPGRGLPDHRKLSPVFGDKEEALMWRGENCRRIPPDPTNLPQDFVCVDGCRSKPN